MKYRPWGSTDWVLSLSSPKRWHFIGALGTTERSLSCWLLLKKHKLIQSEHIALIEDVDSERFREINRAALEGNIREFVGHGGQQNEVRKFNLMDELFQILEFAKNGAGVLPSVILDITAFPKRFFFPLIRTLMRSQAISDLLITYTSPAEYTDELLYEDIEPWKTLPGFSGKPNQQEHWIVSVGFLVESLRQYLGDHPDHERMKLLIPYPAPLPVLRRMWESMVRLEGGQLESGSTRPRFEKIRVDTLDMSSTFDRILSLAALSKKPTAFAPLGPKPLSAAMCLYAVQKDSAVYYPQPTIYHPRYAIGVRGNDPQKAVTAYWIKHEGENLYAVE